MTPLLLALVEAGILPRDDAERIHRTLDPDEARLQAERTLAKSFQRGLSAQQRRIIEVMHNTQGQPTTLDFSRLWQAEDDLLWASVGDDITRIAIDRAVSASISTINPDMWMVVNEEVSSWVEQYYTSPDAGDFGSIPNLNATSRNQFANAFEMWQRGDRTPGNYADGLPQLINELTPVFGSVRAERIAVTEVSRVFAQSEIASARANSFITVLQWQTGNDEHVCPICGPRQGMVVSKESDGFRLPTDNTVGYPPAHVRCRCALTQLTGPAYDVLREQGLAGPVDGAGAEVVAPQPEPVPEWTPSMNRATAERWAANSQFKDDVYHITPGVANERSIKANGFNLDAQKFGRMWGDGVYVGADQETADVYRQWTGRSARTLTIKVNVEKPYVYREVYSNFKQNDIVREAFGLPDNASGRTRAVAMIRDNPKGLTGVLSDAGYDALRIIPRDSNVSRVGGNQLVVFDPKKVVVIND